MGLVSNTVWDVLEGIVRLAPGRCRRSLANRFRDPFEDLFEDRIPEWTLSDSRACARITEDKGRRGEALDDQELDSFLTEDKGRRGEALDDQELDSFLAAGALARGSAVVTRNTGEFRNTGLVTVETWTAGAR